MWYTIVTFGPRYGLPRGPWRSHDEAFTAVARWRERKDYLAGTYVSAASARLYGYRTRAEARNGDIGDSPAGGIVCL